MTKAERDEARRLEALRKNLQQRFIAISVMIANSWLEAGNTVEGTVYKPLEEGACSPWIRSQWMKVLKHRDALIKELGLRAMYYAGKKTEEAARNKAFFRDTERTVNFMDQHVVDCMPGASHTDKLKVFTYLLYAAFYDYWCLHPENTSKELRWLVQTFGTLCDRLIPKDSMLVLPLNKAYWAMRNDLQLTSVWGCYDPKQDTEEEIFIKTVPSEVMRAMNDWKRDFATVAA